MDRITRAQLDTATQNVADAFANMGIIAPSYVDPRSTLVLQHGSATYGRAYRLMWRDPSSGGLAGATPAEGFLGMTAREAFRSLCLMRETLGLIPGK